MLSFSETLMLRLRRLKNTEAESTIDWRRGLAIGLLSVLSTVGCSELGLEGSGDAGAEAEATEAEQLPVTPPPVQQVSDDQGYSNLGSGDANPAASTGSNGTASDDDELIAFCRTPEASAVTDLELSGSQFTGRGLVLLQELPALRTLRLDYLQIPEADWEFLRGLNGLESLSLESSNITNRGMTALQPLEQLRFLNLSKTRIDDEGFISLTGLKSLEEIRVNSVLTNGGGFRALVGPNSANAPLRVIVANNTAFGQLGFASVQGLATLESLSVVGSEVNDGSLGGLKGVPELRELILNGNPITDGGLRGLAALRKLEIVEVADARGVTDQIFRYLNRNMNLKTVNVTNTACSLPAAEAFRQSHPQCVVRIAGGGL